MLNMLWIQAVNLGIFSYSRAQIFKERSYAVDRGNVDLGKCELADTVSRAQAFKERNYAVDRGNVDLGKCERADTVLRCLIDFFGTLHDFLHAS
jgi:hypothetical protein